MNKRFATLLFAVGLGAASAPAFASCEYYCANEYRQCMASGMDPASCQQDLDACRYDCGWGQEVQ